MKKQIIPVALLVCALSLTLLFADLKPIYAFSVSQIIISSAGQSPVTWSAPTQRYILNEGGGIIGNVNPTTGAHSTITLTPAAGEAIGSGANCSATLSTCYVTSFGGALPDRIYSFNPLTGAVSATTTVSTSGADINIAGISTLTSTRGHDRWFVAVCSAGGSVLFNLAGQVLGTCGGTVPYPSGTSNIYARQSGIYVAVTTSGATNSFAVWDSTTGLRVCQVNINVGTGGSIEAYNSNFYVVVGTNTINKYDTACSAGTGISGTGITSQIFGLQAVPSEGVFAIEGTTSIAFMNITSSNISTLAFTVNTGVTEQTTTIRNERLAYATGFNQTGVMIDASTTNDPFLFIQYVPAGSSASGNPNIVGGVDCSLPENEETLLCRLHSIATNGTALTGATESTTTSLNNLFIQAGLVEEGSDIKTNGVGYFIIAIMLGIMIAMFALASNMELGKIPPFVWMLGAISIVGSGTAFGLVDTTFFIISILIIIALASMKILSAFERF